MKQRKFTILLAAAAFLFLLGATVLAAEDNTSVPDGSDVPDTSAAQESEAPDSSADWEEEPADMPEEPDSSAQTRPEDQEGEDPEVSVEEYIPDPVGSISFNNLNHRMREGNLQVLALQESIDMLEELDYDDMEEDLRLTLNQLAQAKWMMVQYMNGTLAYERMNQAYSAAREQFDAIKDGDLQSDNADTVRQLKNLQNQIVMAGEATYIALAAMETQEGGLARQLTALDRQLTELDTRYKLGHISSVALQQAQAGRTALSSGLSTLRMNLDTYKGQLELLIGANITGKISLGALPKVTANELNSMDLERDLETAKANSWDLYDAAQTMKDAKKAYTDQGGDADYEYKTKHNILSYTQARHNWLAAKYTYDNTVQNFEVGLRSLYLKVKDYKQVLDAAKTALAVEQDNYTVAQLKRSQGTLSQNGFLDAADKLKEAKEKVASAENDLFSAYHTYRWAVDYGILN